MAIAAALALIAAVLSFAAPLSASADVVGDGPGTISGTVTTTDGQPLAGVFVNVSISAGQGTSFFASTSSDANGAYEFAGLPADTFYVQTYTPGFQQPAGQSATVSEASPVAVVNFTVAPFVVGLGSIAGTVTADGVPVPYTSVSAINQATSQNVYTTTDEAGAFEFTGLSNGPWWVHAYLGSEYQFSTGQTVTLTDSALSFTVDLAFISWPVGTASITGVLTDSATGLAVAGAFISFYGNDVAHQSSTTTDESGSFSVGLLPAGTYTITYGAPGYLGVTEQVLAITDETVTVSHALVPANAAISGHVKAKDGTALAGIYVDAHTTDGNYGGAVTDENGDYVIDGIGAVEYTLTVGGLGTPYKQKQKTVTAVANGSATANFTLKNRTTGAIGGLVLSPTGDDYSAPVCVKLYSPTKKNPIAEVVTSGPGFGDGTYTFDNVKPGSYTVEIEDCDTDPVKLFDNTFLGGAKSKAGATFVTVVAGEDNWGNDVAFEFRTATSSISGHVEKNNGTPLAGLVVQATDGIASSASAVTDPNGNYTIAGLFADEYTVTVGGISTPYAQKQKTVTTVADSSVAVNFSLKKR